ncbi:8-oxoguanine DNA glycosylase OGG fold protein [Pseudonocardia phyllosphaerae]|uniref:8-oxoguanine DNA glycosylase OGG fold protein n=1 Tax=Pseudonocardia phyllosphaerae TaxID=3390502 RepID=UPI00397B2FA8
MSRARRRGSFPGAGFARPGEVRSICDGQSLSSADMSDLPGIPDDLRRRFDAWNDARPEQEPSSWTPRTWRRWLGDRAVFDRLPERVSRNAVTRQFEVAAESADDLALVTDAFIAAMVWGYGPVGLGPYRTRRVLDLNPHAPGVLAKALDDAHKGDRKAAFEAMAGNKLKYLGPAFGTKFLYFASLTAGRDDAVCPVLDSIVAGWFRTHTTFAPKIAAWSWPVYRRYLEILDAWSSELGIRSDQVELLIFDSAWKAVGRAEVADDLPTALLRVRELVADQFPDRESEFARPLDELDDLVARSTDTGS